VNNNIVATWTIAPCCDPTGMY